MHLTPKYNFSLNKSLYFVKLIGERIFRFGRIVDVPRPVEVEKHLVQVLAKGSWGESSCDVERRTACECLLVLFTVPQSGAFLVNLVEFSTLLRLSHLTALHDRQRCLTMRIVPKKVPAPLRVRPKRVFTKMKRCVRFNQTRVMKT